MSKFRQIVEFHGNISANQLISMSLKNNYVWFRNAKAASSTLDVILQGVEYSGLPLTKVNPHGGLACSFHVKPYQLPKQQLETVLSGNQFIRFVFVRNPYSRLVSAFKDKIIRKTKEKRKMLKILGKGDAPIEEEIRFDEFINTVCQSKFQQMDRHWQLQIHSTCAKWIQHDFIGKIENFDYDLERLEKYTNLLVKQENKEDKVFNKSKSKGEWKDYYTETLGQKVAEAFKDDFEVFGYSTNLNLMN